MDNIYLVNYRTTNCEPLKSITRLPEKEAFELAEKLYKENPVPGFERFGAGFESYYYHRIKAEKWLYDEFTAIGGKPQTEHPLYFFVHEWDIVDKLWENKTDKIMKKIALNEIDICDVSFTFGDSCAMLDRPDRKAPFLKDKLQEYIFQNGNDINKLLDNVNQQVGHRVIEAHIWNDKYFK